MSLLLLLTSCLPVLTSARVNVMLIGATGELANTHLLPAFFEKMITDKSLYLIPAATRDPLAGQKSITAALDTYFEMECHSEAQNETENKTLGTCEEQKARVKQNVAPYKQIDVTNEEHWKDLAKLVNVAAKSMRGKAEKAATADAETGRLVYLAIPPHFVDVSSDFIDKHLRLPSHPPQSIDEAPWLRVVIEQPFGLDKQQAVELAEYVEERLDKHEVYRNDHILSKPGLKAIRDLHTLNPGFEERLHKNELARVEVGMYEKADVSDDPIYYNEYGVVRDVMQSHVTELAIAVAMFAEPDPNHNETTDGEKNFHTVTKSETLRHMRAGEAHQHYVAQYQGFTDQLFGSLSEEEKANKTLSSQTPTYAFVTMYFDHTDRWEDVPFLLTAGKKMPENKAFVRYVFKDDAYIEIIVDSDGGGAQIKISEGPHFEANEIKGWDEWIDEGENDHHPVERVLTLISKNDNNPYVDVLENVLKGDTTKFVDRDDLVASWDVWTTVLSQIEEVYSGNNSATLPVYGQSATGEVEGDQNSDNPEVTGELKELQTEESSEPGVDLTSSDLVDMDFMLKNVFPNISFVGEKETDEEQNEFDEEEEFIYHHEDL